MGEKQLASCHSWNANVLGELASLKPDLVFTTSTRFDNEISDEFVPEGYLKAWQALAANRIRVVAVRDNPDFEFDASACVELHGAGADARAGSDGGTAGVRAIALVVCVAAAGKAPGRPQMATAAG